VIKSWSGVQNEHEPRYSSSVFVRPFMAIITNDWQSAQA
jgi:hypothetical protein